MYNFNSHVKKFFFDLLPFYAILRSIPNKLLGVIAMFSAILILLVMPFTDLSRSRGIQFKPLSKAAFFIFVGNFLILMELGAKHVESPFIEFGQISTVIYFAHFLIIVPLISLFENSLIELSTKSYNNSYVLSKLDMVQVQSGFFPSPKLNAPASNYIMERSVRFIRAIHNNNTTCWIDPFTGIRTTYYTNTGMHINSHIIPLPDLGIDPWRDRPTAVAEWVVRNYPNSAVRIVEIAKGTPNPVAPVDPSQNSDDKGGNGKGGNGNGGSSVGGGGSSEVGSSKDNPIIVKKVIIITSIIILLFCASIILLLFCPSIVFAALPMSYCDAPRPWGIYFQDSATPQMEGLVELHDNILFYLVIILFGVGWLLISIVKNYTNTESAISHKYLSHGTLIELIWTITPALILILIAFPSFKLLYLMDEVSDPAMAVLAEGFFTGGLKLHILNKIKDTSLTVWLPMSNRTGEKNNTLVPRLAQVQSTSFLLQLPNMSITRYTKHNFTTFLTKPVYFKKTFHTKVKASNRIGPHNEEVISVLIGSLLGDSYASARTIEGTRFSYKQSQVHKDYLFWLYEFYYKRGYCSNLKPRMYTRKLRNKISNEIKEYYGYEFNTFTFRSFNWIYKLFYKKGTKTLSVKLEQYLTPLALAIWIMDDGGWAKPGVRISSNSFKLEEVQLLANLLKKLFYLSCTVQKINTPGQSSIYIKGESVLKLRKLILPFVIPSMRYKLGL